MLIGLFLATLASGAPQPPEDLRDDGHAVLGCTSLAWLRDHPGLMGPADAGLGPMVSMAGQIGVDPQQPLWVVLRRTEGRLLPLHLRLQLPEGVKLSPMIGMLPGGPRTRQDGTRVDLDWAPEGTPTGLVDAVARAELGAADGGCVLAMAPPDPDDGFTTLLALGGEGARRIAVRLVGLDADGLAGVDPRLVAPLGRPAEAGRRAWASTPTSPDLALRLDLDATPEELLGGLGVTAVDPAVLGRITLHPGTEVGLWGLGQEPTDPYGGTRMTAERAAAVVPIRKPRTVRWWPGRLYRELRRQGADVVKEGRLVGLPSEDGRLWISSACGRLIIATDRDLADALRKRRRGEAWFRDLEKAPVDDPDQPGLLLRRGAEDPMVGRARLDETTLSLDVALGSGGLGDLTVLMSAIR